MNEFEKSINTNESADEFNGEVKEPVSAPEFSPNSFENNMPINNEPKKEVPKAAILAVAAVIIIVAIAAVFLNMNDSSHMTGGGGTSTPQGKLFEAYSEICTDYSDATSYVSLAADGLSLTIDTNPNNSKNNSYESKAISAIHSVNAKLNIPSSVLQKMSQTRALDGMQTQKCGVFTVTWNYHPDNGLNVVYEINQ